MKITCACGAVIHDHTDNLPHKAHIIGDKDLFDFLDAVDDAIESGDPNRGRLCMQVRQAFRCRLAWECTTCGRLYLDDKDHQLVEYAPGNGQPNRIFDRQRDDRAD